MHRHPSAHPGRAIEWLEPRRLLSLSLLADLNTNTPPSAPSAVSVVNGVGFFTATRPETGRELWRTDGTEAGTILVKDLASGPASLNPILLQPAGGRMLFLAGQSTSPELWSSDGTEGGTILLRKFTGRVNASASTGAIAAFTVQGDGIKVLWRSDGTAAGTTELITLRNNLDTPLTAAGPYVFFANNDSFTGRELWRTDGSTAGTFMVADINRGSSPSNPSGITAVGNTVFFGADDGYNGGELWKSNGTRGNATLVTNLEPGTNSAVIEDVAGGTSLLYFTLRKNVWRTDGTPAGTFPLTSYPSSPSSTQFDYHLATIGDRGFIARVDSDTNPVTEVFSTDGTVAGTLPIWNSGGPGARFTNVFSNAVGGRMYFLGGLRKTAYVTDGTPAGTIAVFTEPLIGSGFADLGGGVAVFPANGELYRTDGTPAGTRRVKDINDAPTDPSQPFDMTTVGDRVFFWAGSNEPDIGQIGTYLFATDGTAAGTRHLIRTASMGLSSPYQSSIVPWRGQAYFPCDADGLGLELWTSDGTPAGTHLVADISPGRASTTIEMLYPAGKYLYFAAVTADYGEELWRTDGTAAGTIRLTDVTPGPGYGIAFDGYNPWSFIEHDGLLYFYGWDAERNVHLFRTDGSPKGTVLLADLAPDIYRTDRTNFITAGGRLFIRSSGYFSESELWTTDGTPAGTHVIKDINPGPASSGPASLTAFGGRLFFTAYSPATGNEVWASDGTAEGTVVLRDVNPGPADSTPRHLVTVGDELFFTADDGTHGREWWKTDGTPAGTTMIKDILPGALGSVSVVHDFAAQSLNGLLVFVSYTPGGAEQFWRSDGTSDGTYPLTNFAPALGFDNHYNGRFLGLSQGHLYYEFDTLPYGGEIWQTDGTPEGTGLVGDLIPGPASSNPGKIVNLGSIGLLAVTTPVIDTEPWVIRDDAPPVVLIARPSPRAAKLDWTIRFNEALAPNFSRAGMMLTNLDTGESIPGTSLSIQFDAAGGAIRVQAPPALANLLRDGHYRLSLAAGAVADTVGNRSAVAFSVDLYLLAGDANRNGAVDFEDLVTLAQNYNTSGKTYADGDFDGDGSVDFNDLVILAQRYNTTLPPPVGSAPARVTTLAPRSAVKQLSTRLFSTTRVSNPSPARPRPVMRPQRR